MAHTDDELANAILDIVRQWLDDHRPDLGRAVGRLRSLAQLPPGGDYIDDDDPVVPPGGETGEETEPVYELHLAAGGGHELIPDTTAKLLYINALPAGIGATGVLGHVRLNPRQFTVDADGVISLVATTTNTVQIGGVDVQINGATVVMST